MALLKILSYIFVIIALIVFIKLMGMKTNVNLRTKILTSVLFSLIIALLIFFGYIFIIFIAVLIILIILLALLFWLFGKGKIEIKKL